MYGKTECVHNSRDNLGKGLYFFAGGVLRAKGFDTFWSSTAANHLREYLNDIKGKYVFRLTYMFVLLCTSSMSEELLKQLLENLKKQSPCLFPAFLHTAHKAITARSTDSQRDVTSIFHKVYAHFVDKPKFQKFEG